jgi:hypothetical protein
MKGWRRVKPWRVWGCPWWARGWLGPWVALAGLISEGTEEGVLDRLGLTLVGYRAGWGRGSLLLDLLMKGWRRVRLGRLGLTL